MKLQVNKEIITTLTDEDDITSLSFGRPELRLCKRCFSKRLISLFPKKGSGRYENKCKPCHNRLVNERRYKKKMSDQRSSLSTIPYRLEFINGSSTDFADVLYSLLKVENISNFPEQLPTIESLLKVKSNIETILKEKGD